MKVTAALLLSVVALVRPIPAQPALVPVRLRLPLAPPEVLSLPEVHDLNCSDRKCLWESS